MSDSNIDSKAFFHKNAKIEHPIVLSSFSEVHDEVKIGKYSAIGRHTIIYRNTNIGRYCSIGRYVEIGLARHPIDWLSTHVFQFNLGLFKADSELNQIKLKKRNELMHPQTIIGNDVWIGAKASIASGITIGDGAIILAHACVTKDVEPYSIVGGVPAHTVKKRFSNENITRLLAIKWWEFPASKLKNVDFDNIEIAIPQLEYIKEWIELEKRK